LAKKILIANEVGKVADMIFAKDISEMNIAFAWLAAFTYMMQIYYDFSGYSDMAIGIGNIFGFKFAENFNYPYIAVSIQDFWRRWHISLSSWFKEYVYIPLGGNRKGKARTILNKYIVFALTGIWHGANWTFLIWGLYHGTFLMIESLFKKSKKENSRTNKTILSILGFVYSFLVVCFGFVIFRADSLSDAFMIIKNMIGLGNLGIQPEIYLYLTPFYIFVYLTAFIGSTGVFKIIMEKVFKKNDYLLMALSVSYLLLCFMSLACDSYNPFIYFRF
ncbi:MAG: MBOAT family protein, partial [Lachnospiraceae bacterium]|nr:MBOAT family protein [Lachnospiraceae bacterium]